MQQFWRCRHVRRRGLRPIRFSSLANSVSRKERFRSGPRNRETVPAYHAPANHPSHAKQRTLVLRRAKPSMNRPVWCTFRPADPCNQPGKADGSGGNQSYQYLEPMSHDLARSEM
jgi:hypothetical protein